MREAAIVLARPEASLLLGEESLLRMNSKLSCAIKTLREVTSPSRPFFSDVMCASEEALVDVFKRGFGGRCPATAATLQVQEASNGSPFNLELRVG